MKIEIKHINDSVLFIADIENNNLIKTIEKAVTERADLSEANLSGADLSGADLSGANLNVAYLSGANLSGADLSGANLNVAYLSGANLSEANLSGVDLSGAYLSGAYLSGAFYSNFKIKKCALFIGLYKYLVMSIITEDDEKYIKMGCYLKTLNEWKKDFWNNENEFPNNKSEKSELRIFAYKTALNWFKLQNSIK